MTSPGGAHRHPAWFGSVMGTAALGLAAVGQADVLGSWLDGLAVGLAIVATLLAVYLAPRYLGRTRDRIALAEEFTDPAHGAMLATFPAGILVLAIAWARIGPLVIPADVALAVSAVLVVVGAVIAIGVSIGWASAQGRGSADLAGVNGGWLIPPVMSLLVPLALAPQVLAHPQQASWILAVALAFYGIGTLLFLTLFALLVARLSLRPPIPGQMSPSLWIPLAPAGILGLAFLRIAEAGAAVGVLPDAIVGLGVVVSAMGIGLGLWWTLFALGDLVRVRRAGGVPFHPGWWGFVFPVAAMQLSITALGEALDSGVVAAAALIAFIVLVAVWIGVAVRSAGALRRGRPGA